jgi:hypothetical protein
MNSILDQLSNSLDYRKASVVKDIDPLAPSSRKKRNPPEGAGMGFVYKVPPRRCIFVIFAGEGNAAAGRKDKQDGVSIFLREP